MHGCREGGRPLEKQALPSVDAQDTMDIVKCESVVQLLDDICACTILGSLLLCKDWSARIHIIPNGHCRLSSRLILQVLEGVVDLVLEHL